jgi:peptide/nickel transport system substrate-binding protein
MKRLCALLLCGSLLMLCGCDSNSDQPYQPTGGALYQEDATEPNQSEITKEQLLMPYYPNRSLNPYQCTDYTNKNLLSLIYQGLFSIDQDYQAWPILCKSYQVSWDMKTYTFTLAEASFSDGSALTAADVVASLKEAKNSVVYKGRFEQVDKISVAKDGKVEIKLKTACENLPLLLDVPIVKESQVDATSPLGTGPYVFEASEQPSLQRRSGWWCVGSVPVTAQSIRLMNAGTPSELRDAFEFSNLTLVTTDPGNDTYADFHSDYELWESENGIFLYLACNKDSKVLSNEDLRRELLQAVDREGIVAEFYRGFATAATLPASPDFPAYPSALANQYPYDPMRLTQAVEEYRDTTQEEVILLVNSDDSIRLRIANKLAHDFNSCGLKVRVNPLTTKEFVHALEKGEFDLYLGQTRLSPNMDLSAFFSPKGSLSVGGMADVTTYSLCLEALANSGNYYNLYQKILEKGMLCPILFRSYAIYTQRGSFRGLTPARDNLFFYHLGRTLEEALVKE